MTKKTITRLSSLMLVALSATWLAACGDSDEPTEPSVTEPTPTPTPSPAPTPTPTPTPATNGDAAEAALLEIMSLACDKGMACAEPGSDDFPFASAAECIAMFEQLLADYDIAAGVNAGELQFDPAVAATCLEDLPAALETQSCEEFLNSDDPPVAACTTVIDDLFGDEDAE